MSPSLLIFPLCARPGHLYQSVRPTSKGKVSAVDGWAILVIHVMPGGLVGQGAEFSRSSCVLVKLTARQPERVSISLLSLSLSKSLPPLPSPPSACLARRPDLLKLTLNQKYPLSPPSSLPWTYPSGWTEKLPSLRMTLDHFSPPAHSSQRGGQGRGAAAVPALWLYHYRAADMYTVYQAQPVISILYFVMAKYKCAFVGSK